MNHSFYSRFVEGRVKPGFETEILRLQSTGAHPKEGGITIKFYDDDLNCKFFFTLEQARAVAVKILATVEE